MSRFLFVVPPLSGHTYPAVAVANALAGRGHEIAWAGPESFLRTVLGPDAAIYRTGLRLYRGTRPGEPSVALSFLDGYVIPLAKFTLAAVDKAVREYEPQVVVADQTAIAGALAAKRAGVPWATLLPSSMGLYAHRAPEFDAWAAGPLTALCTGSDVPLASPDDVLSVMFSPHLQVAFTTTALAGDVPELGHVAMVGPALHRRLGEPPFPLEWLDPERAHVLVTMGTLNVEASSDFFRRVVAALAPLGDRLQAIVLAPPEVVPDAPDHVRVVPRADVLELMPRMDAVVCHAGTNTVGEALAYGVPLVLAPITLDQPTTADQVVRAGAGIRVDFASVTATELSEAILTILTDSRLHAAAERVCDSFAAGGGAAAAAARLDRLALAAVTG